MKPKVLVADDEPHIVYVVAVKLRSAGFEVLVANDGQEALETAIREKPDCIITDLQMPRMGGLEFCHRLRQIPELASVPIILLTAKGFEINIDGDTQVAKLGRADDPDYVVGPINKIVTKPFSPRELLAIVRQAIADAEENVYAGSGAGATSEL